MKPTEEWKTSYEGGVIQVGPASEPNIAWVTTQEYAHLIITAVNACKEICPSNPQAVAEALPRVMDTLKTIRDLPDEIACPTVKNYVEQALKEIGK